MLYKQDNRKLPQWWLESEQHLVEQSARLLSGYHMSVEFTKGNKVAETLSLPRMVTGEFTRLSITNYYIVTVWGNIFGRETLKLYFRAILLGGLMSDCTTKTERVQMFLLVNISDSW